jgi:translocation and assembly module TamB
LRVKASNVDVAQLEKLLVQDRGVAGLLSADVRLTGSLESPRAEGSVALNQGRVRTFAFESLTANVDYTGSGVQLDARLQQNAQQWLTAKGYAPMTLFRIEPTARAEHVDPSDVDRVDLQIESSPIDLGVVQGFTTQVVDVTGTVQANLRVGGSGRDPHVEGVVTVSGGSFKVPAGGVTYTGLDTRIDLQPERVVVSGFEMRDGGGDPLLVSGELAVHERSVGAVNLQIQADSFEVVDNELGDVEVNSRLRITGELRRPRVEGDIKLHAGRIEVDQVLATLATGPYATEASAAPVVEPGVRVAASSGGAREATTLSLEAAAAGAAPIAPVNPLPPEPSGVFNQLALDVRVQIPDNLVLRGADLRPGGRSGLALGDINMTVGGDLRVRKQPGSPVALLGTINTVRGFYQFQGRRFEVTRDGRVRFTGLPEINPLLDVTAERNISGVIARVHVRGTARRPELTLSSTPTLDQADILSLIVFNQPINNLDSGERVALAQRAGAIASGFVTSPLAESIGRALDLDLFEIETTGEAAGFGASVTVGQQVNEQLFLKFRQHFGTQDASEFILEYQIARFLRLQGSGAPGATTKTNRSLQRRVERGAADLIFFFSY